MFFLGIAIVSVIVNMPVAVYPSPVIIRWSGAHVPFAAKGDGKCQKGLIPDTERSCETAKISNWSNGTSLVSSSRPRNLADDHRGGM